MGRVRAPRRPGELVTRGDVCHLHRDRDAAERCGAGLDGTPDLIRVAAINRLGRVYRVVWSLSDTAGGTLRAAPGYPQPGRAGKAQRDRDELAAFKALFGPLALAVLSAGAAVSGQEPLHELTEIAHVGGGDPARASLLNCAGCTDSDPSRAARRVSSATGSATKRNGRSRTRTWWFVTP